MIKRFFKLGCLFFIALGILQVILVVVFGDDQKKEESLTDITEQKLTEKSKEDLVYKNTPEAIITDYEILPIARVGLDNQNRATQKLVLKLNPIDEMSVKTLMKHIWTQNGKRFEEYTIFVYEPNMDVNDSAAYIAEFDKNGLVEFMNLK
jgi:hypothetical protein